LMQAGDDVAAQVDQGHIDADRRSMDADRKPSIRIDPEHRRRQAASLRVLAKGDEIVLLFQFPDDRRNSLDCQSHTSGNFAARSWAVQADRLQHDPSVVRPAKLLVGPSECHAQPLPLGDVTPTDYLVKRNSEMIFNSPSRLQILPRSNPVWTRVSQTFLWCGSWRIVRRSECCRASGAWATLL
jgi:hypothetical protein